MPRAKQIHVPRFQLESILNTYLPKRVFDQSLVLMKLEMYEGSERYQIDQK